MAQNNPANTEQELNEILRLRREKLAALKEAGSDPYTVTKYDFDSDSETIKNNFDEFEGKNRKNCRQNNVPQNNGQGKLCGSCRLQR